MFLGIIDGKELLHIEFDEAEITCKFLFVN